MLGVGSLRLLITPLLFLVRRLSASEGTRLEGAASVAHAEFLSLCCEFLKSRCTSFVHDAAFHAQAPVDGSPKFMSSIRQACHFVSQSFNHLTHGECRDG
jgi:hypothetical protein